MARTSKNTTPASSGIPLLERLAKHPRALPGVGLASFVVLAFVALRYHVVGDYGVETDFFWSYVPSARQVLDGSIAIEDFRGPLYPVALALLGSVFGDFFTGGIILSALSGAVGIAALFSLFRLYVRPDAALIGALIAGATPFYVQYAYTAGTDMLFTCLLFSGVAVFFRPGESKLRDILVASFLFALAYLTRYNGVFVLITVPAVILFVNPFRWNRQDKIRMAGIAAGAFLLFIAPWGVYCLVEKGSFFYSKNHLNIAYEMFAKGIVSWDAYWQTASTSYPSLASVVLADPVRFFGTVVNNALEHAKSDLGSLLGWHLGIPALIGFFVMVREKAGRNVAALMLFALMNFGILLLVFYGERFSLSLLPAYVLAVTWLFSLPGLNRVRLWNRVPLGGLALVVLFVWTCSRSYSYNRVTIASGPVELVELSRWVQRNLPPEEREKVVVSRKPHAGFYLGMQWEYFPTVQTYEELLSELKRLKASYLLFGLMEAGMRPQFRYLLDPKNAPRELSPVVYTSSPPAVLYKLVLEEQ